MKQLLPFPLIFILLSTTCESESGTKNNERQTPSRHAGGTGCSETRSREHIHKTCLVINNQVILNLIREVI